MKIATYNINGINGRLPQLLEWLGAAAPDIVCLQEIKCDDARFPAAALRQVGYGALWRGQRSFHGVAILARGAEPVETRRALPGDPSDTQSRYIEAAVSGVLIGCLYAPNGNPQPSPKFDYKVAWMDRLAAHAAALLAADVPVVLAGDYNVVPTDEDIYATRSWTDNALLQPRPRAVFAGMLAQGWTDALRARHPDRAPYTFWDYKRDRWARDAGLRIDHLLLSPDMASRLEDCGVNREIRGRLGASDHAPAWIRLGPGRQLLSGGQGEI